jgi:hypothetical protein
VPPKGFYNVGVAINTPGVVLNGVGQVQIAMIGWRE